MALFARRSRTMFSVSHRYFGKTAMPSPETGGERPAAWRGSRLFRVRRKEMESEEIASFYLVPGDGGGVAAHRPGQHVCLRMQIDGREVRRNYSLSDDGQGRHYRISVKREPDGLGSGHLHDWVGVGDMLELFPPAGDFVLDHGTKPLVLLSGGVGITPMLAMLHAALASGRPVFFVHAARHTGVHAFRACIEAVAARHPQVHCFSCYERHAAAGGAAAAPTVVGLLGFEHLEAWLPPDRDLEAYVVGPLPFMRAMRRHLVRLGVPASQTHHEFFGPTERLDWVLRVPAASALGRCRSSLRRTAFYSRGSTINRKKFMSIQPALLSRTGAAADASKRTPGNADTLRTPPSFVRDAKADSKPGPVSANRAAPTGVASPGTKDSSLAHYIGDVYRACNALGLAPGQQKSLQLDGKTMILRRTSSGDAYVLQTPEDAESAPFNGLHINDQSEMRLNMDLIGTSFPQLKEAMTQLNLLRASLGVQSSSNPGFFLL
jgi:ferredoxin-NADP reductase